MKMIKTWETKIKNIICKNNTQNDYIDLAPIDEISEGKEYIKTLHWAIKNKRVKNIALTGPYGSGKSSIINSYLKSHRSLYARYIHDGKHLRISMATFSELSGKPASEQLSDNLINFSSEEIEKEILKQMFYKVKPSRIPQSRYRKLHKRRIWVTWICFILASLIAVGMCFVFLPDTFDKIIDLISKAGSKLLLTNKSTALISGLSFLALSGLISVAWNQFCNRIHIKEIKVKDATISSKKDSTESVFDKYMDEILYFFEVTHYRVVFFEDLDRLKTPKIFVELRELNTILNNSDSIKRKITFIYAIKDDIFTGQDRTKFFEFIIPVIPTINSTNSGEVMLELFKPSPEAIGEDAITNEYILDVSPFISDRRVLNNIYNEFQLYKRTLSVEQELHLRDQEMLSLIIFKNLYPSNFADLQAEKGIVKDSFSSKRSFINAKSQEIAQKIQDDLALIDSVKSEICNNVKELKISFLSGVTGFRGVVLYFYSKPSYSSYRIASAEEFLEEGFDISHLVTKTDVGVHYCKWNGSESDLDWPVIKDPFEQYSERLTTLQKVESERIERIQQRIEDNQMTLHNLSKMSIRAVIEKFGTTELFPKVEQNGLLTFMLRNGYIDETYNNYMNYFKGNSITAEDMNFILNIKNHVEPDFRYPLVKREEVINRLQVHEFEQESALNFNLLEELLSNHKNDHKLDAFIQQLVSSNEMRWSFVDEFMNTTEFSERFIELLANAHSELWDLIYANSSISDHHKFEYLSKLLHNEHVAIETIMAQNLNGNLSRFITEHENALSILKDVKSQRIISVISNLRIVFYKLDISGVAPVILDFIFDNGMYIPNSSMIFTIVRYKNISLCARVNSQNYTVLMELNYQPLLQKVQENLSEYIDNVVTQAENSHESISAVMDLIQKTDDMSLCEKILKSQDFCCTDIKDCLSDLIDEKAVFVQEIWKLLLSLKRVSVSWNNVLSYWSHFDADSFIRDFITDNIDDLCRSDYPNIPNDDFEGDIVRLEFSPAAFTKLTEVFSMNQIEQIASSDIPKSNISILIASNKVPFTLKRYNEILTIYPDLEQNFIVSNQQDFSYDIPLKEEMVEHLLIDDRCVASFKKSLVENYCPNLISTPIADAIADQKIPVDTNLFAKIWPMLDPERQLMLLVNNLLILKSNDLQKYFSAMDAPYSSLANRSSRHVVDLPDNDFNLKIAEYLDRINYITSFERATLKRSCEDRNHKWIEEDSVIKCRVKVYNQR